MDKNPYLPKIVKIRNVIQDTEDIKTFVLDYKPNFVPGQFYMIGLVGFGEAPFTASSASGTFLEVSIKKIGSLTSELHKLKKNDVVTLRGPYGNGFPYEQLSGKNLLLVGGGIGLAPLKSLIELVLKDRSKFGRMTLLYGAKDETQIMYEEHLKNLWPNMDVSVNVCVDRKKSASSWPKSVCLVPDLIDIVFKKKKDELRNTISIICGPPIMIKFVIKKLLEYDIEEGNIIATLERQMKCGFGKCGHCNIGGVYVCLDGPVFNYKEIKKFIEEF